MSVRVLASGVDSVYATVRGAVQPALLATLDEARERARSEDEDVPYEFSVSGQAFLLRPYGKRGWRYWLSSPDYELFISTNESEKFPAVQVQLHSAYLHSCGVGAALDRVSALLLDEVLSVYALDMVGSRVDLYADVQPWALGLDHLPRFVSMGRWRRGFLAEHEAEVYTRGRRFTGFVFGKGKSLQCRIYDKTLEIGRRGLRWLPELWGEGDAEVPVWRVEFQFRREVLADFRAAGAEGGLRTVDEVLAAAQDLWAYATGTWLTYRRPTADARERRWPLDPLWERVQQAPIAAVSVGAVRAREDEAAEEVLVRGLQGYLSSWAARCGYRDLDAALRAAGPRVRLELGARDRSFEGEVRRKAARQLHVTAPEGQP